MINSVNIIDGIESYKDFLNGLAGEYEDVYGWKHEAEDASQSYRRFPMIICLYEEDFNILLNKGWMESTHEFKSYITYKNIVGNFARMNKLASADKDKLQAQLTAPIVSAFEKAKEVVKPVEKIDMSEFKDYGKTREQVNRERELEASKSAAEQQTYYTQDTNKPIGEQLTIDEFGGD